MVAVGHGVSLDDDAGVDVDCAGAEDVAGFDAGRPAEGVVTELCVDRIARSVGNVCREDSHLAVIRSEDARPRKRDDQPLAGEAPSRELLNGALDATFDEAQNRAHREQSRDLEIHRRMIAHEPARDPMIRVAADDGSPPRRGEHEQDALGVEHLDGFIEELKTAATIHRASS